MIFCLPRRPRAARLRRGVATGTTPRGQSLVEFALILPFLLILVLAIVDFARLYTTMLTVESGAREAADYGAFHWYNWKPANTSGTVVDMYKRVNIATKNLPDFAEVGGDCTSADSNPTCTYTLTAPPSNPSEDCTAEPPATGDPCRVTVTLTYDFHLLAPLHLDLFGVQLGLPNTLSFSRVSTFAVSNFGIDAP